MERKESGDVCDYNQGSRVDLYSLQLLFAITSILVWLHAPSRFYFLSPAQLCTKPHLLLLPLFAFLASLEKSRLSL